MKLPQLTRKYDSSNSLETGNQKITYLKSSNNGYENWPLRMTNNVSSRIDPEKLGYPECTDIMNKAIRLENCDNYNTSCAQIDRTLSSSQSKTDLETNSKPPPGQERISRPSVKKYRTPTNNITSQQRTNQEEVVTCNQNESHSIDEDKIRDKPSCYRTNLKLAQSFDRQGILPHSTPSKRSRSINLRSSTCKQEQLFLNEPKPKVSEVSVRFYCHVELSDCKFV